MKIWAIVTGSTGMVGEGVLLECLQHPEIEKVLVINQNPCGVIHPKLSEILHKDFYDLSPIADQLKDYDACFFCLGVISLNKKDPEYFASTYKLTMHMAEILAKQNPCMTFCYVSGVGADPSEKVKSKWARMKGKTENDLMNLPFRAIFVFRPGFIQPTKGLTRAHKAYEMLRLLYPFLVTLFPIYVGTLKELALAMINSALIGYNKKVLEVMDIRELSRENL